MAYLDAIPFGLPAHVTLVPSDARRTAPRCSQLTFDTNPEVSTQHLATRANARHETYRKIPLVFLLGPVGRIQETIVTWWRANAR